MQKDFSRVAIVNRGEPAMRLIHAVQDYNRDNHTALRTIALFTEPDRRAMFVREADETFELGPATFVDQRDGERKVSYLDYDRLQRALLATRAEAAWVGWGFVAEHAEFVDLCNRLGIVFIGPSAEVMRNLGDKITSKLLAEKAGVAAIPWSGGPVETLAEARHHAQRLGYPIMIKATAGGGGRGIRKVCTSAELAGSFARAGAEALKAFGNATVFLERTMKPARHVEVQILGDSYGTIWAVGVRDCTMQRRHQKILEESPSPALRAEQHQALCDAATRIAGTLNYVNAGTVEFLFDTAREKFYFMEVNARLQVEHPVTELTTGLDLVKLQLHLARGGKLEGPPPAVSGHAIEVRLNAEDPANLFAAAPGTISLLRLPLGPGIRVDTGVAEGDTVPSEYDAMIAKIIAHGRDRREALSRLQRALAQTAVIIQNGMSNKGLLQELLNRPEVAAAQFDIGWLDRLVQENQHLTRQHAEIALLHAAIETYLAEIEIEKATFITSAHRGRPQVQPRSGVVVDLAYQGENYKFGVYRLGTLHFRIDVEGQSIHARAEALGNFEWRLTLGETSYRVLSKVQGSLNLVEVNGIPYRLSRDHLGVIRAPSPAVVISILVREGQTVRAGDRLAVLEAMKMEMTVVAPFAGTVKQILGRNNIQVDTGAPLLVVEPASHEQEIKGAGRVRFDHLASLPPALQDLSSRCAQNVEAVKCLLLGFDTDPSELQHLMHARGKWCAAIPADDRALWQGEDEILSIFVDLISLFRREPAVDDELGDDGRLSSEEYFFSYLLNTEAGDEGLPASFTHRLRRALAHYGIQSLDPGPELDLSLFRICKSHQRMARQIEPILSILARRLEHIELLSSHKQDGDFQALLDHICAETQGRFSTVNELAREVRYRYFDQALLEQARNRVYETAVSHLDYLTLHPEAAAGNARIEDLVQCPQPLQNLLSRRFEDAGPEMRRLMLEVMSRRYYSIRHLEELRHQVLAGQNLMTAEYDYQDKCIHLITSHADFDHLPEVARSLCPLLKKVPPSHDVVIDFYVWQPHNSAAPPEGVEEYCTLFDQANFPRPIRRIVVVSSGPHCSLGMSGLRIYTFRQNEKGFHEEKALRGLHPMMGKRLQIWRLSHFEIERLPSVEDVYLFKGVAKENPDDERLFAFAEVRDLTEVRREQGRLVQYPNLELMLQEALAGIRRFRSQQPPDKRQHWNRVLLYIWPPLLVSRDELQVIIRRLAPTTEGLGLEKVLVRARMPQHGTGELKETIIDISSPAGGGLVTRFRAPSEQPIRPVSDYKKKVIRLQRRGLIYPYELVKMLTPNGDGTQADLPAGQFMEYDFDHDNRLVPVHRSYGKNKANIVIGVIRNSTPKHREGMVRVALCGDPSVGVGSLAEPECRRIIAGLDLAEQLGVPLEWFAVSAGAKISMDSGTENMDWIALVLRRLVEFTQAGGEVNIVVTGINVGAQPYWNAEATMLMHTRGILIMMPESAMVLTGKQALEYSGGVAAEDNQGIGGYERIMGPNGQAQYFAHDLGEACKILLRHYDHTYLAPGERFPRPAVTTDPRDRDVRVYAHGGEFATVGEVFSDEKNPGRKKPFDVRKVMMAVIDQDRAPLERWFGMQDAEIGVVWDAHLGGQPVCLLGFESRPLPRLGIVPADGPQQWTAGTLFPLSSKKLARAINAASGNRPLVVLANLSGFDGSPESMRKWQLEYGAEIGRAVVNFRGPIVFCVVSRYHGGAFVVFSNALHDNMEVAALEGTYASVIGGAPAAAVVFAREVEKRAQLDSRMLCLESEIALAKGAEKTQLRSQWQKLYQAVYSEKLGEVADEFDGIHSVQRALRVGSVNRIIPPEQLRPYLIEAVERGMQRELELMIHARQRPHHHTNLKYVPQKWNGDGTQSRINVGVQP